jgi:hypothetical protein
VKKILIILIILVQTTFGQPIWNGKADTKWYKMFAKEFTITTPEQLAGLAKLVNGGKDFKDKTVKLGANIMLNDTANWQSWASSPPANKWIPIGTSRKRLFLGTDSNFFNGTLDGNNFSVSGVYINSDSNDQGLLGYLGTQGTVENFGLAASYIKGRCNVGGIAGLSKYGRIINSYSSAFVTGEEENNIPSELCGAGGIAGINKGYLINSYSTGTISGKNNIGGLAGRNHGIISNSYFAGKIASAGGGGLAGWNYMESGMNKSYYDMESSGSADNNGGIGKTTSEMQSKAFVDSLNISASFLSMNAWVYEAGKYPGLSSRPAKIDISSFFASGNGTEKNPYIINTRRHLEDFSMLVNMGHHFFGNHLKLGASIALNDTLGWQEWADNPPANVWTPIGIYFYKPFKGNFNGGDFFVSGVYINSEAKNKQGFFGNVNSGGVVRNLGVIASYIKGKGNIGGLVGMNAGGIISSSYFSGIVDGVSEGIIGGLVGYNEGTINRSYSTGLVMGKHCTGGLVGINVYGTISSSYSASVVETDYSAGGLVGLNNSGTINNSYSTGAVAGELYAGGLVGANNSEDLNNKIPYIHAIISNSYSTGAVTGKEYVGGFAGFNSGKISNSYSTGAVKETKGLGCGGFVADNTGTISNSYSAGTVTGNGIVGGFVGNMRNWMRNGKKESMVINSYYDKETNGQSDGVGNYYSGIYKDEGKAKAEIYGKTVKEMKQKATFKGWDFIQNWDISDTINGGYPYLRGNKTQHRNLP